MQGYELTPPGVPRLGRVRIEQPAAVAAPALKEVPSKVVYADLRYPAKWVTWGSGGIEFIADSLAAKGYHLVDADQLREFMAARDVNTCVVFAQDVIPDTVVDDPTLATPNSLILQYMERGGRVVWVGDVPFGFIGLANGLANTLGTSGQSTVLGAGISDWDNQEVVTITKSGAQWGLTQTWRSRRPSPGDVVALATVPNSASAAAFYVHFGGRGLSGFVRLWDAVTDFVSEPHIEDLDRICSFQGPLAANTPAPRDSTTLSLDRPPATRVAHTPALKAAPPTIDPLLDVRYLSQRVSRDPGGYHSAHALQTEASQVVALAFIEHVDAAKGWALQNDGTVLTTDDAGKSWRIVATNLVTCCDGDLFFINHATGWAVGGKGQVARTDDGGRRWTRYRSGTDFALENVYFLDGERIFATAGGELLRSFNMGIDWEPVASSQGPRNITFLRTDHNYGWVVGDGGDVLLTRDSGESWIAAWEAPGGAVAGAELTSAHFVTKDLSWAVSRDAVILRTLDGGLTWERVFEGNRKGLRAVTFTPGGTGWAVGDDGLVVRFEPAEAAVALAAEAFVEDFEGDFADRVELPEGWEVMEEADGNHALFGGFVGREAVSVGVIAVPEAEEYTFQIDMSPHFPDQPRGCVVIR